MSDDTKPNTTDPTLTEDGFDGYYAARTRDASARPGKFDPALWWAGYRIGERDAADLSALNALHVI